MRLLICTQWFDPEPSLKGLGFAKGLAARGFQVEVLTGFPNYPGGRVYPGYKLRPYQREVVEGIVVHRCWLYPSHDRSPVRRTLNYLSFMLSAGILGLRKTERPDIVYGYHPPATTGWLAAWLANWFGSMLVLDVQDLWPDTLSSSGMMQPGPAWRLLDALCRWEYRRADRIVALSTGMAHLLRERGVSQSRVCVIRNWADESRLAARGQSTKKSEQLPISRNSFSILFAGQMGEAQGLDTILRAAELTPHIAWDFLGDGSERGRLEQLAQERGLANVSFYPRVRIEEVGAWLEAAGALLVHLKDDPLFEASIPSKTQAYLRVGRPILMAVHGDAADIVLAAGAGLVANPGDPQSIGEAARRMEAMPLAQRDLMGANGRAYYQRELSMDIGLDRFAALFRGMEGRTG